MRLIPAKASFTGLLGLLAVSLVVRLIVAVLGLSVMSVLGEAALFRP